MILNFLCRTAKKESFTEIKRRSYIAGAYIIKESVIEKDGGFLGLLEISSYSGSLYKEIELLNLSELELNITGGYRNVSE
jgi:hypothetical protein|tara:strand:+ start:940 stop:1179 length:240 start_codon:yes stop_codon:yes gene_type:complete